MNRKNLKDRVWLQVCFDISQLATCARRKVGCAMLDRKGRVLATGYNGVAPDEVHCIDSPCAGANCPSGTGLELCEAIHAEQNAIAQLKFPDEVHTVYSTTAPCMHCVKMLATTAAKRIVFSVDYPHPAAKDYWERRGGTWEHVPIEPSTTTGGGVMQRSGEPLKALAGWFKRVWRAACRW